MLLEYSDDGKKYVAYNVYEEEAIDDFQIRVINANEGIGVLNISYRLVNGESALVYKVSNHMKLKKYIRDYIHTATGVYEVMIKILKTIDESSKYYLNSSRFLIDIENIYINNNTKELVLIYLPDITRNEDVKENLIKVQKGMITMFDLSKDFSGAELLLKLEHMLLNEDNDLKGILSSVVTSDTARNRKSDNNAFVPELKEKSLNKRKKCTKKEKNKDTKSKSDTIKVSTKIGKSKGILLAAIIILIIVIEIIVTILKLDFLTVVGINLVLLSILVLGAKKITEKKKVKIGETLESMSELENVKSAYETNIEQRFSEDVIKDTEEMLQINLNQSDDETVLLKASAVEERRKIIISGEIYEINKKKIVLGRSEKYCDLVIKGDISVGRVHAEIIEIDKEHYIKDMGSVNGTFLNDDKIVEGEIKKLEINDVIYLAKGKLQYF